MEGLDALVKLIPGYRRLSATFVLCVGDRQGLQLLGFFASLCWGMTDWDPDVCALYQLGGAFAPALCVEAHIHRLLSPLFLSSNCAHMLCVWLCSMQMGFSLETSFGTARYVLVVLLSVLQGNAAAMVSVRMDVVTGASTSVCCLVGCQLVWVLHSKRSLTGGALLNFLTLASLAFSTCAWPHTSAMADLAAFLSGVLLATVCFPLEFAQETKQICIRTTAALAWISLALLLYLQTSALSFEECESMHYFDREGFRYLAGASCAQLCSEY